MDVSIFLERDTYKENINRVVSLQFENLIDKHIIPARLYDPNTFNKNIILYLHGGGWVNGSVETHDCLCRKIANTLNIRIISVEYRLAPIYKFPCALNDIFSVYCQLCNNKDLDINEIILSGDSSGGNLAASTCIKLAKVEYFKTPLAQILFYPVLSGDFNSNSFIEFGKEPSLTKDMMQYFIYSYTGKEQQSSDTISNKFIYPILEENASIFPKTLIVSAENDVLLDGQCQFASKLKKENVPIEQIIIKNSKHGFMTYGRKNRDLSYIALKTIKYNPLMKVL